LGKVVVGIGLPMAARPLPDLAAHVKEAVAVGRIPADGGGGAESPESPESPESRSPSPRFPGIGQARIELVSSRVDRAGHAPARRLFPLPFGGQAFGLKRTASGARPMVKSNSVMAIRRLGPSL
jgi:hypothetical protein